VTAGVTYNFQFLIQAAMGYTSVGTCATVNSTLSIDVLAGALPTNLFRGYTQTGAGTRVQPPASCTTNGARSSQFGNNGIAGSVLTATGSYTATSTGTIMLRMTFTMPATTAGNNDDWKVTPSLVSCT
jgi:hypothetical protein